MERDGRVSNSSRSEIISRSRVKATVLRPFRGRSIVRTSSVNGNDSGVRENIIALILGVTTTAAIALWMRSVVGTTTLAYHATTGACALLIVAPSGVMAWRLERYFGSRMYARTLHGGIMALFFITLNAAIGLAFKMRLDSHGVHFYSLHSWIGVASLVLAKMAFADAFAAHLTAACNVRTVYGFKVPTFQHTRHISAAIAATFSATSAIILRVAQMQGRIVAKSKAWEVFSLPAIAANIIAIATVVTFALTVVSVKKRRNFIARERDSSGSGVASSKDIKVPDVLDSPSV